jgi:DNA-binding SARP family transcriptional activator/streptogramin lyase
VTEFRILGLLDVRENGHSIDVGGGKQRALLAVLLLRAGETVSTDALADALWGENLPASAPSSMHAYVSRLRKALGRDRVLRSGHGYQLVVEPGELDLDRFQRLCSEGREQLERGDAEGAAGTLRGALALWNGPPLADFTYEPFAGDEIARLEELHLSALEERIEADLALRRHRQLVPELDALVREHPLRERLRGQQMLALYRSGRQADALETYRQARATLVGELGLEPGPALQQLERQILTHDPELEPPAAVSRREGSGRRRRTLTIVAAPAVALAAGAIVFAFSRGNEVEPPNAVPNSVAMIDPATNRIVGDIPVGTHPVGISYSAGDVWIANTDDGTISRVDPQTRTVTKTFGVGAPATDLVVLGRDAVWTGNGSDGTLSRFSPVLSKVVKTVDLRGSDPVTPNPVYGLAYGAGSLWAAVGGGGGVARINPRTAKVVKRIAVPGTPFALAFGNDALWVATALSQLVRIEPRTNMIGVGQPVGFPSSVAARYGDVWVGLRGLRGPARSGAVVQLDAGSLVVLQRFSVPEAVAIAATPDAVWIAGGSTRKVYRLDPRSGRVVHAILVRGVPSGIAVVNDRIWVSIDEPS